MLHELVRYAQQTGLAPEPGFKAKDVRWLLLFDRHGRFVGVHDCTGGDRKSRGRHFTKCPDMGVRAQGGGVAHFLADSLATVVVHPAAEDQAKSAQKHAYFVKLLRQASSDVPALASVADALGDAAQMAKVHAEFAEKKAKPIDSATLAISDAATGAVEPLLESPAAIDWWRTFFGRLSAGDATDAEDAPAPAARMLCLLSGVPAEPAATHPKIEGMSDVGGLSVGVSLASFDKEAFESYGLAKGQNAAMSGVSASVYTGALNDLIRDPNRTRRLAGVKVTYWYAGVSDALENDVMAEFIVPDGIVLDEEDDEPDASASPAEVHQAESRAGKLLAAIESGERADLRDARFYAMTISANAGRMVIRNWMEGSFVDLARAIDQWFADLAIVSRDGFNIVRQFKLIALVGAGVRDLADAQPAMELSLLRSAIQGRPIAAEIAAQALRRAVLDVVNGETAQHRRFALMKAYLKRKGYAMTPELNEDLTDPAYLCGRLMAVLSRIQQAALGDVGAGVVQRYYAAASATPALVLGRLIRTAQTSHLPKIERDEVRIGCERELTEIWGHMKQRPPATLSLEEQTLFAMGYYQQQAKRYKAKDAPTPPEPPAVPPA